MLFTDYKCSVGVVYSGGCASNACRRTINSYTPDRYPDYKHFVANTDAKVLNFHFGDPEEPRQKMWTDAGAFFPHQYGGDKITAGRGAGADPEVAKRAVRTKHSMKALREFYNNIGDGELIFTQGYGKGTGTGAGPEAIKLAVVKMRKSAIAICVMPEPEEGQARMDRARAALKETQSLVPTIVIDNAYFREYTRGMNQKDIKKLSPRECFQIIDDNSLLPALKIARVVLQETGDQSNVDQADYRTFKKLGNRLAFGLYEIAPAKKEGTPEEIAAELCAARFQDASIFTNAKGMIIWAHSPADSPWSKDTLDKVEEQVKTRMTAGSTIEVHHGICQCATDGEKYIAILAAADIAPAAAQAVPVVIEQSPAIEKMVLAAPQPQQIAAAADRAPAIRKTVIRYKVDGEPFERGVTSELATRYIRLSNTLHPKAEDIEEMEKVRIEIKAELKLETLPDPPINFRETAEAVS